MAGSKLSAVLTLPPLKSGWPGPVSQGVDLNVAFSSGEKHCGRLGSSLEYQWYQGLDKKSLLELAISGNHSLMKLFHDHCAVDMTIKWAKVFIGAKSIRRCALIGPCAVFIISVDTLYLG